MELYLKNTTQGLVPCYDDDYDEKKKLRIGEVYKAKIVVPRNILFHRKFFALINCAWAYQNEKRVDFFKGSVDVFRKTLIIAAGHIDLAFSIEHGEWIAQAKSIAFDKMDEAEFSDLYNRVLDVLLARFINHVPEEEFMSNLVNFL